MPGYNNGQLIYRGLSPLSLENVHRWTIDVGDVDFVRVRITCQTPWAYTAGDVIKEVEQVGVIYQQMSGDRNIYPAAHVVNAPYLAIARAYGLEMSICHCFPDLEIA